MILMFLFSFSIFLISFINTQVHWWHSDKTISDVFKTCESESVSLWWINVKLWLQVCCCFFANWCNMKLSHTLRLSTSEWYDLIFWCDLCVLVNVLRQNRNLNWDLIFSMNDKTDFSCSIVKSCDELIKDCDENWKHNRNDCIIKIKVEWLWSLTSEINWRL